MGIARGPNLIKDNLVFGYDTGYGVADNFTATRFYPGEPADNLLFKTGAVNLTTGGDIYVNAVKTSLGNGRYKFVNDSTGGTTIRLYCNLSDLTDGQSYAISLFYEKLVGSLSADWCDTSITSYNNTNGKITGIGTRSTYTSTYRFLDINLSNGGSVILSNPQVESNSHTTPFVDGTRSDTASLIDLTRATNIDVGDASFDSTGQPDLDGTGDFIKASSTHSITSDVTLEAVFNEDASSAPHTTVICTDTGHQYGVKLMAFKNTSRYGLWLGFGSSSYVAMVDGSFSNNTTYHLAGSWDHSSGVVKIYLNGVLKSTQSTGQTSAISLNEAKVVIGADYHSLSYGLNGKVYVGKVYNKVLTDAEVAQNYKAYKNRFNL